MLSNTPDVKLAKKLTRGMIVGIPYSLGAFALLFVATLFWSPYGREPVSNESFMGIIHDTMYTALFVPLALLVIYGFVRICRWAWS